MTAEPSEALSAACLADLAEPRAYPGDPSAAAGIEHVQTHLSHVFLTRERVYKFRKAVDLGFVCFASRGERNADCLREVALNRRLAPDVYLGVAPLRAGDGKAHIGDPGEELARAAGPAEAPEHCVVMRRLPDGRDVLSLLEGGALRPAQLDRIARRVAAFHDAHGLGAPAPWSEAEWIARIREPVEANFAHLAEGPAARELSDLLRSARERERAYVERYGARFERRRRAGRAVHGHGDLHLQHVWLEHDDAEPVVIDCVEFDEDLRRIDAASEVAFTAMDLRYRGHAGLAERFLRIYARERDDFDLYAVVDYFASYRAAVRAKVAAIAARDAEIETAQRTRAIESARRHLALAAGLLADPRPGRLVLVSGLVGTGKTTVSEALADALPGVAVASDRVRKRLAGLAPTERAGAGWREGLYDPAHTDRTYEALLDRAGPIVASGRNAVLDATFGQRSHREQARRWAARHGAPVCLFEVRCRESVALERLARRQAGGADASDAGPELFRRSVEAYEAPSEWPADERVVLDTDGESWRSELEARVRGLLAAPGDAEEACPD